MRTVLVLGATGTQGGAVCRHLSAGGETQILAITRDATSGKAQQTAKLANVELVECDADAPGALDAVVAAHAPLDGIFSVQANDYTSTGVANEIAQGKLVVDLCEKHGVGHLVYSSVAELRPVALKDVGTKIQIEDHLRASSIRFSVLRPSFFVENFMPDGFAATSGKRVGYPGFVANNKHLQQYIYIDDLGMIAAAVFADPDRWAGKTLELAGDSLTPTEIVEVFSKVSGREMTANEMPSDAFGKDLEVLFAFMRDEGWPTIDVDTLRKDFPKLHTLEGALADLGWRVD